MGTWGGCPWACYSFEMLYPVPAHVLDASSPTESKQEEVQEVI